ncbi:MAG: CPXCG motif-containing cysteine-rich protein [Gemmatimonadota bacterium]|jgi:transposase-like protein|nr:CPXCG motif-containing cysteine-rich protein [Gemmatimonadota bacterium]
MDDPLEEPSRLGDAADTAAEVVCPFCWSESEIRLDPGSGHHQEYVEDCPVCCRPWLVRVEYDYDGAAHVSAERADE